MFGLQELFDKQIKDLFTSNKLCARIIENELEGIGLILTKEQLTDLEKQFSNYSGKLSFDFSDNQLTAAGYSSEQEVEPKVKKIIDSLPSNIEDFTKNIDETIQHLVDEVSDSTSESLLKSLQEDMDNMLENQSAIYHGFADDIQSIWGEPLGLLQGLIVISDESAQGYFARSDNYAKNDIVQELLIKMHAKAVQIAKEILTLLKNGFSDGAQARWRTLHELTVISVFIGEHGTEVAERYINHEAIDMYKGAIQYNDYYVRLDAEAISSDEIEGLHTDYLALLDLYGQSYKSDYGWAANTLNSKRPTFRDIENSVDLDHHRPFYKAASANVHGNSTGVLNSLGLLPDSNIILSGPSNIGLSGPAQSTIISLNIITTTMLTHGTTLDAIVISKMIAKYGRKVEHAFIKVESELSD